MESEESTAPKSEFIENQYIRIYGIIKSLQGQKCLQAFKIWPVNELNEITHHMLECMNASIHYANKSGDDMDISANSHGKMTNVNNGNSGFHGHHESNNRDELYNKV
jgi:hypothetical protein